MLPVPELLPGTRCCPENFHHPSADHCLHNVCNMCSATQVCLGLMSLAAERLLQTMWSPMIWRNGSCFAFVAKGIAQAYGRAMTRDNGENESERKAILMKGFSRSICKALSKASAPLRGPRPLIYHCNLQYLVTLTLKNTS